MKLQLYWQVAKNTWDEALEYRISFVIWRLRSVLSTLTLYFLWLVVLPQNKTFFSYNQSLMLTYILGTSIIGAFVFSSRTNEIANEINEGNLTNFLIRPINYLKYYFARDMGDKAMNVVFSFIEFTILILILHPPLFFQTKIVYLILFVLGVLLSILLYFFISVLLGFIGFWSNETWGARFIFLQMIGFFAGGLFPLDILPKPVYTIFTLLPFPYLQYFPLKIYLGQLPYLEVMKGLLISAFWILVVYRLTISIWQKGLRVYTAQGR